MVTASPHRFSILRTISPIGRNDSGSGEPGPDSPPRAPRTSPRACFRYQPSTSRRVTSGPIRLSGVNDDEPTSDFDLGGRPLRTTFSPVLATEIQVGLPRQIATFWRAGHELREETLLPPYPPGPVSTPFPRWPRWVRPGVPRPTTEASGSTAISSVVRRRRTIEKSIRCPPYTTWCRSTDCFATDTYGNLALASRMIWLNRSSICASVRRMAFSSPRTS